MKSSQHKSHEQNVTDQNIFSTKKKIKIKMNKQIKKKKKKKLIKI
jgi:hypothetical protein